MLSLRITCSYHFNFLSWTFFEISPTLTVSLILSFVILSRLRQVRPKHGSESRNAIQTGLPTLTFCCQRTDTGESAVIFIRLWFLRRMVSICHCWWETIMVYTIVCMYVRSVYPGTRTASVVGSTQFLMGKNCRIKPSIEGHSVQTLVVKYCTDFVCYKYT